MRRKKNAWVYKRNQIFNQGSFSSFGEGGRGWGAKLFGKLCVPLKKSWLRPWLMTSRNESLLFCFLGYSKLPWVDSFCSLVSWHSMAVPKQPSLAQEMLTPLHWPLLIPLSEVSCQFNTIDCTHTHLGPSFYWPSLGRARDWVGLC